ncbi:MAG: 3-hydroxyacyl-CoA dehydrogenase NAD-binding domain-containing protein [Bacteroidota bacterium]
MKLGIIGSGAMGSGIAQVALLAGESVCLFDKNKQSVVKAQQIIEAQLSKMVEKQKITADQKNAALSNLSSTDSLAGLQNSDWVIEAIVESLEVKQAVFAELDKMLPNAILASNTSSISITAIAKACQNPSRVMGIHFFNPAPLMPLVEIIPALQTHTNHIPVVLSTIEKWNKVPVVTKDLPGFIVNRLARPYYSEALRIHDEGLATFSEIDEAMKGIGFKMGPFELMDLIGNDVNYAVTESVFAANYFDPKYKPSTTQLRYVQAGWFGRKSGRGYYNYVEAADNLEKKNKLTSEQISERILAMLINEAYDALRTGLANEKDLDLAMTKGVNYPIGLIEWGRKWGKHEVVRIMNDLYAYYGEDRYRLSPAFK